MDMADTEINPLTRQTTVILTNNAPRGVLKRLSSEECVKKLVGAY